MGQFDNDTDLAAVTFNRYTTSGGGDSSGGGGV